MGTQIYYELINYNNAEKGSSKSPNRIKHSGHHIMIFKMTR